MQSASALFYYSMWPFKLYNVISLCPVKGTIVGKKLWNINMFRFSLQIMSGAYLTSRRIQQGIVINVHRYLCKAPIIIV
jgi:hypothetical protein